MTWVRRIHWRWVILGSSLWLILLSSISLQEGNPKFAQWTGIAAVVVVVLAVLIAGLRLLTLFVMAGVHLLLRRVNRSRRRSYTRRATASQARIRR